MERRASTDEMRWDGGGKVSAWRKRHTSRRKQEMRKDMVKCVMVAAAFVAGVASASTVGTSYWEPPMLVAR